VVPEVVIAIRDEDVEDEAPEHWSRSASIASAWTWSAIASARSRSRWSATSMPALAARLASTDSHAPTSWRSARDGNVAIQTVPFSSIAGLPVIRRESRQAFREGRVVEHPVECDDWSLRQLGRLAVPASPHLVVGGSPSRLGQESCAV
jgi:hypothetical protein